MRYTALVLLAALLAGCRGMRPAAPPSQAVRLETASEKRAAFAQAFESFRHGKLDDALPVFTALTASYPELADYHLYFTGTINARRDHDAEADAAFRRLLRGYPQSVKAPAAALELGKLSMRANRVDDARAWFERALLAPDAATTQGARFGLSDADERAGAVPAAYEGFMSVRRDAIGSAVGRAAKQRVLALRAGHRELAPTGHDLLDEAHLLLKERDYAAADQAAQQLLEQGPESDFAEALRVRGEALYGRGQIDAALGMLRTVVERYPGTDAAPSALFRSASILWNRDRDDEALRAFEAFDVRYPGRARADECLYAIGRIHERAGRTERAITAYTSLSRRFPRSTVAAEARWRIGWIEYRQHNWNAAAAAFSRLAAGAASAREQNAADYWRGRAEERAGQTQTARDLYRAIVDREPADYYAMWAEQRLNQTPPAPAAVTGDAVPAAATGPGGAGLRDPFHLPRYDELKAAGVYRLAVGELAAIEREHPNDPAVARHLLRAYQTVDGYAAALRLMRRLGTGVDLSAAERERLLYPLAFWTSVRRAATANAVDPLLVEAVMRQESLFDADARSPADARGLMQLLPSTAERLASTSDLDLLQPETNIELGTRYLQILLTRFDQDLLKAVAAYNGGETAVEKWERRFPDIEADEFVENISFRETRDYVKRVVSNYRKYQQLYSGGAAGAAGPRTIGPPGRSPFGRSGVPSREVDSRATCSCPRELAVCRTWNNDATQRGADPPNRRRPQVLDGAQRAL